MADGDVMDSLDNLLIQLALQTRELSVKKEDLQRHVQECKANIQLKKTHIEESKKNIDKLDEQITQKQRTVQHYKENTKGLKRTHGLLLQYEKVLESELERRQENCNRDTKMYQDRVENYKVVLRKHREKYHQHPLAQKLLKIQAENEEIERRIRACEEQIVAGEKERLQGVAMNTVLQENPDESASTGDIELQFVGQGEPSVDMMDPLSQSAGCDPQDEGAGLGEERMEEMAAGHPDDGQSRAAVPANPGGGGPIWTSPGTRAAQREVADQAQLGEMDQDESFNMSGMAEEMDNEFEGVTVESQNPPTATTAADAAAVGVPELESAGDSAAPPHTPRSRMKSAPPHTPPSRMKSAPPHTPPSRMKSAPPHTPPSRMKSAPPHTPPSRMKSASPETPPSRMKSASPETPPSRMKAALSTPTFSLASPSGPLSRSDSSEGKSPGFVFSMTSEPSTPGFSGFGFDMGSTAREEKSPEAKFSGFPFDQSESRSEEDFPFSFSSKSPMQQPTSEDKSGAGDGFPFSFNFGKF